MQVDFLDPVKGSLIIPGYRQLTVAASNRHLPQMLGNKRSLKMLGWHKMEGIRVEEAGKDTPQSLNFFTAGQAPLLPFLPSFHGPPPPLPTTQNRRT